VSTREVHFRAAHYVIVPTFSGPQLRLTTALPGKKNVRTATFALRVIPRKWQRLCLTSNKTCGKQKGRSIQTLRAHDVLLNHCSIIFSCWTRTLDLIARHLHQRSIPFESIDGGCPLPRRQRILDDFATNPRLPVLIMTTGTGAFG
jgi:SNF2 family DNA or RNA helicase